MKNSLTLFFCLFTCTIFGQLIDVEDIPNYKYTRKSFVVNEDSMKFKNSANKNEGLTRTYVSLDLNFFDLDDTKKYVTAIRQKILNCIEGYYIQGKRNGNFSYFILDSLNPNIRYKIWDQEYKNGKLHGVSRAYTLQGKLAARYEYKDDSIVGKSTLYAADGISPLEELIYEKKPGSYIKRNYNDTSGKLEREETYVNYLLNGKARDFYPNGQVEMEEFYINGKLNGTRRHFYPSGARWTEVEYRNGKTWNALGSYLENGKPLYPGTLSNGTGVLHIRDKFGVIQETYMFMKGDFVK